tara:strand:- start:804 stop:1040 length:237 start_codon:yes stop_codon:yes gene_type:complete
MVDEPFKQLALSHPFSTSPFNSTTSMWSQTGGISSDKVTSEQSVPRLTDASADTLFLLDKGEKSNKLQQGSSLQHEVN